MITWTTRRPYPPYGRMGTEMASQSKNPPPGGASFLEMYGLQNVLTGWMLGRGLSELVAEPAKWFSGGRVIPPRCPGSHASALAFKPPPQMHWRGAEFVCYQHQPPVRVPVRHEFPTAPIGDVLSRTGEMLDYVWIAEPPHWEIRALKAGCPHDS